MAGSATENPFVLSEVEGRAPSAAPASRASTALSTNGEGAACASASASTSPTTSAPVRFEPVEKQPPAPGAGSRQARTEREGGGGGRDAGAKPLRFAGYAALFDRVDRGGDVIRKGAFARAVAAGAGRLPLLWQHDPARPIGRIEAIAEDERGLRVIARLSGSGGGRDAAALVADGALSGLSFGYRVRDGCPRAPRGGREISDLDLVEISLVTFPMQPGARVHAVAEE